MNPHRPKRRPLIIALYVNAVLLLGILAALIFHGGGGPLATQAQAAPPNSQPITGGGNLYIMPAQLLSNIWGCYLLDVENQTLCTYAYNGNQLRLIAARNIRYDHRLGNYNTHPDPEEIRRLVEAEQARPRGAGQGGPQQPPATQEAPRPPE